MQFSANLMLFNAAGSTSVAEAQTSLNVMKKMKAGAQQRILELMAEGQPMLSEHLNDVVREVVGTAQSRAR